MLNGLAFSYHNSLWRLCPLAGNWPLACPSEISEKGQILPRRPLFVNVPVAIQFRVIPPNNL